MAYGNGKKKAAKKKPKGMVSGTSRKGKKVIKSRAKKYK
jgi:hypothetical protein